MTNPPQQGESEPISELRQALYKLIADISGEAEQYIVSEGRLIRLPMEARIEPILTLIQQKQAEAKVEEVRYLWDKMPGEFNGWKQSDIDKIFSNRLAELRKQV